MNKELLEKLVNEGLKTGADFSEIFHEEKKETLISFSSSIVNKCSIDLTNGVGIRLAKKNEVYYGCTSDITEDNLLEIINKLNKNFNGKRVMKNITLKDCDSKKANIKMQDNLENLEKIKCKLYEYDKFARNLDDRIIQVNINVLTKKQKVTIANSYGKFINELRFLSRFILNIIVKENGKSESSSFDIGAAKGLEIIEDDKIFDKIKETLEIAIDKLRAKSCPGGEMPVVIGSGMGGVLIHEACGHAMEATTVSDKTSVLSDKLNTKIASDKVTIIDDGTIDNEWGTTFYDDEANQTQKNVLIENGVLKKFLIDEISTRVMEGKISGSGRRENFTFTPTSRMNNTYLAKGNDTFEEMISSIKYGLYAKRMGGGVVNPATGDFNFAVISAYLIRDGKIAEPVKGVSLIGNTLDILEEIEMVGNDLKLSSGECGSISGYVPVNVGQPTIKLGKILVGGDSSD